MKDTANKIFGVFENFKSGKCTYDKALEDASKIIEKAADERPIVGYVHSKAVKSVFHEILKVKKQKPDKTYLYDCEIHQNDIQSIERMYKSM